MNINTILSRYIKGVGPQRQNMLKRLNINMVSDCLCYYPRRYEDRSNIRSIAQLIPEQQQTFAGKVVSSSMFRTKRGKAIFQIKISDETASIYALWFNQPYMKKYFNKDDKVIMFAKVQKSPTLKVIHPEYEIIKQDEEDAGWKIHTGRIVPIYPLVSGVNQRRLRSIVKNCVDQYSDHIKDHMPTNVRARHHLLDLRSATINIHFPVNDLQKKQARRRLVFDEFMFLQIGLALKRHNIKSNYCGTEHNISEEFKKQFIATLGFDLTKSQSKVITQIEKDMASPHPMHRLLQGEVGSGKTAVSAYALALTAHNNHQGVIMVPTEILARQHYLTLSKILMPLGIEVCILINEMPKKEKQEAVEFIKSGKAQVVVGTHALIQESVTFKDLKLAIIDEQHKFGVEQRSVFSAKGGSLPDAEDKGLAGASGGKNKAHILVMSATPIPRTLAMSLYGDMDMSVIDEMPHGVRKVETFLVSESQKEKAYDFLKEEVENNRQAYIVSPVIEESDKLQIEGAQKLYKTLQEKFKDFKLALMHGRLKADEKIKTMKEFKKGNIDILVCTTVIEVGIDVSNASVMIVENAERFGLSQLHQLRGRIGRGKHQSYCILVSEQKTETAVSRLDAMVKTDDGFKIAEEDMAIRGTGELFGKRQHGISEFELANLTEDIGLLEEARKEAFAIIEQDPDLKDPHHQLLKQKILTKFKDTFALGMIG